MGGVNHTGPRHAHVMHWGCWECLLVVHRTIISQCAAHSVTDTSGACGWDIACLALDAVCFLVKYAVMQGSLQVVKKPWAHLRVHVADTVALLHCCCWPKLCHAFGQDLYPLCSSHAGLCSYPVTVTPRMCVRVSLYCTDAGCVSVARLIAY